MVKKDGMFSYFLILTSFFLLLEISFFIQCNRYLSDFCFVADSLHIPITILPGVIYYIIVQLMVHFVYCVIAWMVARLAGDLLQISAQHRLRFGLFIWTLGLVTLLVSNQYYFSNSKFAELTALILFNQPLTQIVWTTLTLICCVFTAFALVELAKRLIRLSIDRPFPFLLFFSGVTLGFIFFSTKSVAVTDASNQEKPNIIIIGVDSLRPDFLSYFGHDRRTPFFDSFLNQATVFSESLTPLARTFPSWSGILTGRYPKEIEIRTNLPQLKGMEFSNWLPAILQQHGYTTVFATDETRFSNIDTKFGFDQVVSPPIGLNDFLLGTFNDFPLSNLLINTTLGKWLFPYSYANRPVYPLYEPNSFLELLRPKLQEPRTKPIFLAVHFCLTHYPYLWASLSGRDYSILQRYEESVVRVDKQLNDFLHLLKENNFLNHAIVVLLSDHGEALELPGDRITEKELFLSNKLFKTAPHFYPPSLDEEDINQSAGHGGDVLGLPQYHTVLAFRLFGLGQQQYGVFSGIVSLLDVKPTILQLINLPVGKVSGISLLPVIKGQGKLPKRKHVFLESDISPEAIRTVYPEIRKVLLEGIEIFQIDQATTHLVTKESMGEMIINSKQYADICGEWMLALYPQNNTERMPILINLTTGIWTNDLHSVFAKNSPAQPMLEALRAFYGAEIQKIS